MFDLTVLTYARQYREKHATQPIKLPFIKVVLKENFTLSSGIPRLTDLPVINFIACHSQLKGGEMQSFMWKCDFFGMKN